MPSHHLVDTAEGWAIHGWIDGRSYADDLVDDERRAARDLARFVVELRRTDHIDGAPADL